MNKELYGEEYDIPDNIINHIQKFLFRYPSNVDGIDRAKNLINLKKVNYNQLKRILHDMKYMDKQGSDFIKYNLCGGYPMEQWGLGQLSGRRYNIKNNKEITKKAKEEGSINGMGSNAYLAHHEKKDNLKADFNTDLLSEIKKIKKNYKIIWPQNLNK
jgi:hypothetical protein